MKKIILIVLLLIVSGCGQKPFEELDNLEKPKQKIIEEEKYVDNNPVKIGLYTHSNNKYTLYKEYKDTITNNKDINTFQLLPTNEESISYQGNTIEFIKNYWDGIVDPYKLGIILEYSLVDGQKIKHVIYDPTNTLDNVHYIQVYLYDAISHRNDKWYSHITKEEFDEDTYITSFKLTAGEKSSDIVFPIKLSVFTYDTEDDFLNEEYRGNSIHCILIYNEK